MLGVLGAGIACTFLVALVFGCIGIGQVVSEKIWGVFGNFGAYMLTCLLVTGVLWSILATIVVGLGQMFGG